MLRRLIQPFSPLSVPLMSRPSYRRELVSSMTLPVAAAMVEGGVVGVLATLVFSVGPMQLATITAAPMFANLTSFVWARLARGRPKVRCIAALQVAALLAIATIALLPVNEAGRWMLVAAVVCARCMMAGVITLRSTVWRHNYRRERRGRITGRLAMVAALLLLVAPTVAAFLLDTAPDSFRVFYPIAACIGVVGAVSYSRLRLRGERALLRFERESGAEPTPHGGAGAIYEYDDTTRPARPVRLLGGFSVLRRDPMFRRYMTWQFVAGVANMMVEPVVIAVVTGLTVGMASQFAISIGLTQLLPAALMMLTLPVWSGLLDRMHIARFRVLQAWLWVVGQTVMGIGAILSGSPVMALWVLALGRATLGVARGGGMLAWNLGHNDFASREMVTVYMGVHVTLTGVRGAFAAFLGMALYESAAIGGYVFFIAAALSTMALTGFYTLHRRIVAGGHGVAAD